MQTICESEFTSMDRLNKFVHTSINPKDIISIQRFINSNRDIVYILFYKH